MHRDVVSEVIGIFGELYSARFPIEKMRTVDHYPRADDELSMEDDNTSAFNCRLLPSGSWSLHAYGRAVDVTPWSIRTSQPPAICSRSRRGPTWTTPAPIRG